MAFSIDRLVAALPVLALGHAACSAVGVRGRPQSHGTLDSAARAQVRACHMTKAVCCLAPASCCRAPSAGEFPLILRGHVCWQATVLPKPTNEAGIPCVSLGPVDLSEHVPSRRCAVDRAGAEYISAGFVRAFGELRSVGRVFMIKKAPLAGVKRKEYKHFSITSSARVDNRRDPEQN